MKFEKGKPKTGGREKGIANKVTKDLRESIKALLEEQFEQVAADLKGLEPKSRVEAWLKLAEFVLPKLQRTEIDAALSTPEADSRPITVLEISYRGENGPLKLESSK
ncbi:MAG TPA: hypothetical protein PL134_09590 [Smithellaceae bacterium]|nr:hypothetical protein [Smithellaceae bacterium]